MTDYKICYVNNYPNDSLVHCRLINDNNVDNNISNVTNNIINNSNNIIISLIIIVIMIDKY